MGTLLLKGARVVSPGVDLPRADVAIKGDRIVAVSETPLPAADETVDVAGLVVAPGFIDIHTHGRSGRDFCDLTDEAFDVMGRDRLKDGVTGFLATGLTRPESDLAELCRCVERYKARTASPSTPQPFNHSTPQPFNHSTPQPFNFSTFQPSNFSTFQPSNFSTCLGVHLEGPFFNPEMAGAQNPAYLRNPDLGMVERLHAISPVKKVSFAPELEGSEDFVRGLVRLGIVASGGHSAADFATFERARAAGMTHLTHFCNAMIPIHHLRPSMVTGGLLADDVFVEMICDGVHLSDPMIALISRMKGPDRTMLITDSMCAAGCPDGMYSLGGLRVRVADGCARLADVPYDPKSVVSNVAGSVALFHRCFQRYARVSGLPLAEAIKATSWNQCVSLGIPDRGKVEPGFVADLVLLDRELNPVAAMVNGRLAESIAIGQRMASQRGTGVSPVQR